MRAKRQSPLHLVRDSFTVSDSLCVHEARKKLPPLEYAVLTLRFWHDRTIEQIADQLELSWDQVDSILFASLGTMRELCLADPNFRKRARALKPPYLDRGYLDQKPPSFGTLEK